MSVSAVTAASAAATSASLSALVASGALCDVHIPDWFLSLLFVSFCLAFIECMARQIVKFIKGGKQ